MQVTYKRKQRHILTSSQGPVATSIKNESAATQSEFSELANSRQKPTYTAANDTELTKSKDAQHLRQAV